MSSASDCKNVVAQINDLVTQKPVQRLIMFLMKLIYSVQRGVDSDLSGNLLPSSTISGFGG